MRFEDENAWLTQKLMAELFGGIVANTDRNYRGRWICFDKTSKDFKDKSFDNWTDLDLG